MVWAIGQSLVQGRSMSVAVHGMGIGGIDKEAHLRLWVVKRCIFDQIVGME